MKVNIEYRTQYLYDEEVGFSAHIVRLFPRVDRFRKVDRVRFDTNAGADVQYRRDLFDNDIASCTYKGSTRNLQFILELDLTLEEVNPFHFLLAPHAMDFPFTYTPAERAILAPFLQKEDATELELPFWKVPPAPTPTVEALVSLNAAIHDNLRYMRREEGAAWRPNETLHNGAGACRDLALLLVEFLRSNNTAARLASGYLCEFSSQERRAEGALHAWVEAYLPGAGWVGLDPTNGTFCNHHHIPAAVGYATADVTPISGNYYSHHHVQAHMDSALAISAAS